MRANGITIRRTAAKRRRAAAAKLANRSTLSEAAPVGLLILDGTTTITQFNRAALGLTGGGTADVLHRRPGDALHCVHSVQDPRGCSYSTDCPPCPVRNGIQAVLDGGGTLQGGEVEVEVIRDGRPRRIWLELDALPLQRHGGRQVCVALKDITVRKQAQAQQAARAAQHRQLQKAESLSRMAGAIAHHFNNQLMVVMGNLELVLQALPRQAPLGLRLMDALQGARRAAEVGRTMLTYLGSVPSNQTRLELATFCHKQLPRLCIDLPQNVVVVETHWPDPSPHLFADEQQLQEILGHLLRNAWEACGTAPGIIHLTVRRMAAADIPGAHRAPCDWQPLPRTYACLEVTDTGCGMSGEFIEKIFDPFFSTKFTGRGMGLAVVAGLMRAHTGGLTVESAPGHGCTVRAYFPELA